ncbi:MAG: DUF4423 domain-containing protein [Myxococcales bacterium]|jgi:transcriptional regulator with XRE-family HTH domain
MDPSLENTASEFLRAARGRRSQVAFARRLGYRANPITDWENGRRYPTAAEALRACGRAGINVAAAFSRFHAAPPPDPVDAREALSAWLTGIRGSIAIVELAERCGRSRFAVARWLKGEAEPRLPDFFRLVDAITGRLPDLVAELVPIERVPSLLPRFRAATIAKSLAFEEPWTEAVLRLLETEAYRRRDGHDARFLAERLGIEDTHAERVLERLRRAGIIQKRGAHYGVEGALSVDTRADPDAMRGLVTHWNRVALDRYGLAPDRDYFAYNVLSVSQRDLERVRALLRATYREIRAIVAASEPTETAALINLQLVQWGRPGDDHDRGSDDG